MYRIEKRAKCELKIENYPYWMSEILSARGIRNYIDAEKFLNPQITDINDPFLLKDMKIAVELLKNAKDCDKRVVVYGDYDVDGVCSCAILSELLNDFGLKNDVYIPDRYQEGYGLNSNAILELSKCYDLLLSCDCGVSANEEIKLAKSLGMKVIITDHHTVPEILPVCDALVVPSLENYPFPYLCGAGVAWKLSCALMGLEYAQNQLDLAAIATIADMVSLTGENRAIVKLGLEKIAISQRQGIIAIKNILGLHGKRISSEDIGFQIAPRLNAGGRFSCATDAYKLLSSNSLEEAAVLANRLNAFNEQRKEDESSILSFAEEKLLDIDLVEKRSIVIYGANFNSGVVGLAAGRLANKYAYPCVVLTDNDGMLVGSGRSVGDIDLYKALKGCESLFERFGGHKHAAGLSLPPDKLDDFIKMFDDCVKSQLAGGDIKQSILYDTEITFDEVNKDSYDYIQRLEPFGMDNPKPLFLSRAVQPIVAKAVGANSKHLKLTLQDSKEIRDGIAFNMGSMLESLCSRFDVYYNISENEFRGNVSYQCMLNEILPSENAIISDTTLDLSSLSRLFEKAIGSEYKGEYISISDIDKVDERDTLLICYSGETAQKMHEKFPELPIRRSLPNDPRRYSCICYQTAELELKAPYKNLIYCDGIVSDKLIIHSSENAANVYALTQSEELKKMLRSIRLDVDALRELYIEIKKQVYLSENDGNIFLSLVLMEQGLIKRDSYSQRFMIDIVKKCNPLDSWVYKAIKI